MLRIQDRRSIGSSVLNCVPSLMNSRGASRISDTWSAIVNDYGVMEGEKKDWSMVTKTEYVVVGKSP